MDYSNFDWKTYILIYPDLKINNITNKNTAWNHWINHGKSESRTYFNINDYNNFDWNTYITIYSDLKLNNITTLTSAWSHWINNGKSEGRIYFNINDYNNFDWKKYINKNDKNNNLLHINNKFDAWINWILHEKNKQKNYNLFIPEIYKFLNDDLNNYDNLLEHFKLYGISENRKYTIDDFISKTNFDHNIYNKFYNLNLNLTDSILHLFSNRNNVIYPNIFFYEKYPDFNIKIFKVFNNINNDNELDLFNSFHLGDKNIIYSLNTFYLNYPEFNYIIYRKINNITNTTEVDTIINWFLHDKTYDFLQNINVNDFNRKKIIIYPHEDFNYNNGGIVVQYNLAYNIDLLGEQVRIYDSFKKHQSKFQVNYFNNDFPIDENVMVIYCESIKNNPINAVNVTRWILSRIGMNVPIDNCKDWGNNDLIYYFNCEKDFYNNFVNNKYIYKTLSLLYLNSNIQNFNNIRDNYCYTLRKNYIHENINYIHPLNSYEITRNHDQSDYINIFNKYEYFISYDPLCFLSIIAALCGCISIIYPINGITKEEWYKTTAVVKYLQDNNIDNLYGIAYGNSEEEIEYAKKTIHLVKDQWNDIINYFNNDVLNYIKDVNNINNENLFIKINLPPENNN
jgi:hypothetical protein